MSKTITRGTTIGAIDEIINPIPAGTNNIGKVELSFSGAIYENQKTMVNDNADRFETTSKILLDVIIYVETYDALFGNATNQRFARTAGTTFGFTKVDISTLYFKNKTAGQNTKITIIGTEA